MKSIRYEQVTLSYGEEIVLRDFSCEIPGTGITAAVGSSGTGKTTFLKSVLGLIRPTKGTILNLPRRVSAVFQEDRLFEEFSVWRNILAVCPEYSTRREELERELRELGLNEVLSKKINELSGGMKRRVSIVRALLFESEFIVMDEPFRGLDDENAERVRQWIERKRSGRGILLSVHEKREAERLNASILTLDAVRGE